jgi:prepilin-type N-terminal cleavage/methylation domain-containing protein
MRSNKKINGFTLIELLLVIAIIGILVAVVLTNLRTSRDKGEDAGVKTNIINARSQAEVYYTNHNRSYLGLCNDTTDGIFKQMQVAAKAENITPRGTYVLTDAGAYNKETCHDSAGAYAAWVPLKTASFGASASGNPVGLCIDSLNNTKIVNADLPANLTTCP